MVKKKSKKRWLKWLLYFLLFIIICVVVIALSADKILENKVKKEISTYFENDSSGMYDIEYDSVQIRIWLGDFKITNLRIKPKEHYIDSLKNNQLDLIMRIGADEVLIKKLDIRKLLFDKLIEIDKIHFIGPLIEYAYNPDLKVEKETKPIDEILSDVFVSARIDDFLIQNASIIVYDVKTADTSDLRIDSATLHIDNILIDTNTLRQNIPMSYGQLSLDVRAVHLGILAMYTINFDDFDISIKDSLLSISNFRLTPKWSLSMIMMSLTGL